MMSGWGEVNPIHTEHGSQGMRKLAEAIAPGASHNSAERYDPPKCRPQTREAVLKEIMDWVKGLEESKRSCLFMWLYGPADAGKSAIVRTIARLCCELNLLAASFFFSRTVEGRNDHSCLIATLTYQLCQSIPEIRTYVEDAIELDPNVFSLSLETQVETLIIGPLSRFRDNLSRYRGHIHPMLIIIDGLDECISAIHVLSSFQIFVERLPIPMFFLFTSRPEAYFRGFFTAEPISSITTTLALDGFYQPDADIKLFLEGRFDAIKRNHPSRARLPESWPSSVDIGHIVRKSSGQLIYASTVMKFVESHHHWPMDRLTIIFYIMSRSKDTPFAALDALYTHMLSLVEDINEVSDIFGVLLFANPPKLHKSSALIEHFLGLRSGDLGITLIDLHSILDIPYVGEIQLFHTSLEDFLLDPTRSGKYFINRRHVHANLARHLTRRIPQEVTCDPGTSPLFYQGLPGFTKPVPMLLYSEIAILNQLSSVIFTMQCMRSYPTAELLDALWNLKLFPFWTYFYAHSNNPALLHSFVSVPDFFTWLKNTGSIRDGQSLHSRYMIAWDRYIQHSLSQLFPGPVQSQYLVFFILTQIRNNYQARDVFAWDTFGAEYQILIKLFVTLLRVSRNDSRYNRFLTKFFDDPNRSGRFYLDGDAYASFTIIFTKYIVKRTSYSTTQDWGCNLSCFSILLSKSSYSTMLVTLLESLQSLIEARLAPELAREAGDIVKTYLNTPQSIPAYQSAEDSQIAMNHTGINPSKEDSNAPTSKSSFAPSIVNQTKMGAQTGPAFSNLSTPQSQESPTVEDSTAHIKPSRESPKVNEDVSPHKRPLRVNQNVVVSVPATNRRLLAVDGDKTTGKQSLSASTTHAPAHPSTIACTVALTEPSSAASAAPITTPQDITATPSQPTSGFPSRRPTTISRGGGRHSPTRLTHNLGRGSPRGRGGRGRGRWL